MFFHCPLDGEQFTSASWKGGVLIVVLHLNILKSGVFMPFAGIVMLRPCPDTLPCQEYKVLSDAAENAQVIELLDSDYVLLSEEDNEKEVNEGTA